MDLSFSSILKKDNNSLYNVHFIIPSQVIEQLKILKVERFMCALNDAPPFHSSAIPKGEGIYFIKINKEQRKQLGLDWGDSCRITLTKDKSKYGMPIAKEMLLLFEQDPDGDEYFHSLSAGKQRSLLFLINKIKNTNGRLEKAFIILEHLKEVNGELDFKRLNQDFKNKRGVL